MLFKSSAKVRVSGRIVCHFAPVWRQLWAKKTHHVVGRERREKQIETTPLSFSSQSSYVSPLGVHVWTLSFFSPHQNFKLVEFLLLRSPRREREVGRGIWRFPAICQRTLLFPGNAGKCYTERKKMRIERILTRVHTRDGRQIKLRNWLLFFSLPSLERLMMGMFLACHRNKKPLLTPPLTTHWMDGGIL